jgi:hypothetical protein
MSDAKQIKGLLRTRIGELAPYLYPNGKREGVHWCVGDINGSPGKSFKICVAGEKAGLWGDFADSQKHSRNLLDLWMQARNVDFKTALHEVAQWTGHPLNGVKTRAEAPTNTAKAEPTKAPVTPRPLGELLDATCGYLRRFVIFRSSEHAVVCALWALHTWLSDAFDYTPYLHVFSTEKRSGKTKLLDCLELVTRKPWRVVSSSIAVLFRRVERDNPSLLFDEIDTVFSGGAKDEDTKQLRAFINAGYEREAGHFSRCTGPNRDILQDFDPFCPKALAGIGKVLHDTVDDRCLKIELERQSREEKAERFRKREVKKEVESLQAELAALDQDKVLIEKLRQARPELPEELNDRQQEICEPLLAIAELAGEQWPEKARGALIKVCCQEEDASTGVKLLTAIRGIFDKRKADKLTTEMILEDLVAIEDGPWAFMFEDALKHDKLRIAAAKLAGKLKGYKNPDNEKIKPRTIKLTDGTTAKGYHRSDFEKAWKLYCPSFPISGTNVTNVTNVTNEGKEVTASQKVTTDDVTAANDVTGASLVKTPKVTTVTTVTTNRDIGHRRANCVADGGPPCTNDGPLCEACEQFQKESKTLFPGDWLFFRDAADFRVFYCDQLPLPERCIGVEDSPEIIEHDACLTSPSCGCNPAEQPDGFYYHPTRHVARCCDYQHAAWWAQGFEVLNGFPFGDWDATTEERLAEQEERAKRELAALERKVQAQNRQQGMTPGQFLVEATALFNATPAKDGEL